MITSKLSSKAQTTIPQPVRTALHLREGDEVWDVVKIPFPYTNRLVQQRRPALLVAIPHALGRPLFATIPSSLVCKSWIDCGDVSLAQAFNRLLLRAIAVGRRRQSLRDSTLAQYCADLDRRLDRTLALRSAPS